MIDLRKGDCLEVMDELIEEGVKVDLTVTSPPYDNLRTYEGTLVWNEDIWKQAIEKLYNITASGGVVVWIVGDSMIKGSETLTSFKQAIHFNKVGFRVHDTMIWEKPCFSMPSSNRYHQVFEYMFIFSKGKLNTFNGIKDRPTKGFLSFGKNSRRQPDGSMKQMGERKRDNPIGMRYNVWKNNTVNHEYVCRRPPHPAMFPKSLIRDHIISWSNAGDIVLDPFMGSGTTGVMAKQLGRNFIGIDIVEEYVDIATDRIDKAKEQQDWLV